MVANLDNDVLYEIETWCDIETKMNLRRARGLATWRPIKKGYEKLLKFSVPFEWIAVHFEWIDDVRGEHAWRCVVKLGTRHQLQKVITNNPFSDYSFITYRFDDDDLLDYLPNTIEEYLNQVDSDDDKDVEYCVECNEPESSEDGAWCNACVLFFCDECWTRQTNNQDGCCDECAEEGFRHMSYSESWSESK